MCSNQLTSKVTSMVNYGAQSDHIRNLIFRCYPIIIVQRRNDLTPSGVLQVHNSLPTFLLVPVTTENPPDGK